MSDQDWKETNTQILNQRGTPPPAGILATLVALSGRAPKSLATFVTSEDDSTTYEVVGITDAHLIRVVGQKPEKDWHGGGFRKGKAEDETIQGDLYPLSNLLSLSYELDRVYLGEGSWADSSTTGKWTARFTGGGEVTFGNTDPYIGSLASDAVGVIADRLRSHLG